MGIQDFNKEVQRAVNREQDEEFIFALIKRARELGIESANIDLIYGLPFQTKESFAHTLERVIELNPDRMSVFNYAHLPDRIAAQRKIKDETLPSAETKLAILQHSISYLTASGYDFIGMDHFAKPTDELSIAQRKGELHRNFQGYTTQQEDDLLGLGVSSISLLGDQYAQNHKDLKSYYANIEKSGKALHKGFALSTEDCLRRDIIKALICNFQLDFSEIEEQYKINFTEHFAEDLALLEPLADDGLLTLNKDSIHVSPKGRLLIRNICLCFDTYSRALAKRQQFSRVI